MEKFFIQDLQNRWDRYGTSKQKMLYFAQQKDTGEECLWTDNLIASPLELRKKFFFAYMAMEIEKIPKVPQEILEASRGNLVVFVGAGASQLIGCPSWTGFAQNYLKYLFEKGLINYSEFSHLSKKDPRQILTICQDIVRKKIKPKAYQKLLKKLLRADKKLQKKSKFFQDLYAINGIFVTTNYDEHLDNVAPSSKVKFKRSELVSANLMPGNILHLHGSVKQPDEIVMTLVEYIQSYDKTANQADLLVEIFNKTVLFVGYGLGEFEVLEFMINKSRKPEKVMQNFMLFPVFTEEENLYKMYQGYYKKLGITLVPYPIGENGYRQLESVIEDWSKKIGPASMPPLVIERRKIIDKALSKKG